MFDFIFRFRMKSILSVLVGLILGHIFYTSLKGLHEFRIISEEEIFHRASISFNLDGNDDFTGSKNNIVFETRQNLTYSIKHYSTIRSPGSSVSGLKWEDLLEMPSDPKVWVVTPTYSHTQQYLFLTRTFQALYPVKHFIHWLIVIVKEDEESTISTHNINRRRESKKSLRRLKRFIRQFPISIRLVECNKRKKHLKEAVVGSPKGVEGRRAALEYLRDLNNLAVDGKEGVVFFADDDNTYDSRIFYQIQNQTKTISIWPAGALEEYQVIAPIVRKGIVRQIFASWTDGRRYPLDFAQFAVHISLIRKHSKATIPYMQGYQEDFFLREFKIPLETFQPLASNCTKILVWHTKSFARSRNQSERNKLLSQIMKLPSINNTNNLLKLLKKYNLNETNDVAPEPTSKSKVIKAPVNSQPKSQNQTKNSTFIANSKRSKLNESKMEMRAQKGMPLIKTQPSKSRNKDNLKSKSYKMNNQKQ